MRNAFKLSVTRRTFCMLLAMLLLLPLMPTAFSSSADNGTFSVDVTASLHAGAKGTKLYVTVQNNSAAALSNVKASLETDGVLALASGETAEKEVAASLPAGASRTITYAVDVSASAPSSTSVAVAVRHGDSAAERHTVSLAVGSGAAVSLRDVSFSRKLYADTTCLMTLTLVNAGTAAATDINVNLSGFDGSVALDNDSATKHIDRIEAGQTAVVVYQIKANASAAGISTLKANISYSSEGFPPEETEGVVNVPVSTVPDIDPDPVDETLPELIIDSFTADPKEIQSGSTVKFTIKVINPAFSATDSKVRVTVSAAGDIMLPSGQSNVLVLDPVSSLTPRTGSISFDVKSGLETQMCDITVRLDYTDANGKVCQVSSTQSIKINGKGGTVKPESRISLSGFSTNPAAVPANSRFVASLIYKNAGTVDFSAVSFSIANLSADGFSPIGDGAIYNAGTLKAGATGKATFTLYAGEGLKPGVNELEVSGIFTTADGEQTEFSQKFFVQVAYSAVSSDAPNLVVTSATAPNAKAGEKASLTVVVENRGKGTAENAVLTVSGLSASGIMLQDTLDTFTVGTLKAGAKKTLVIPLKISKECAAYTSLELTLKHSASADTAAQTIYLSVTPSEDSPTGDDDVSLPRVIVDSYTIDPETVQAGGNFQFTFTLKNTSKTLAITNFKITISSADGIFTPVSGSNTFYTESIAPGATGEYSIQLNAKAAAEQKSYPISIAVEYEYGKGKSFSGSEEINVYVIQPIRLEFSNINYQPSAMSGESIYLSLSYFNKGKSPLNNLTVSMEGDFMLSEGDQFIGNFPAGSSDYFEAQLFPMNVGTVTGTLVFTFEDDAGNQQRKEVPISVEVMENIDPVGPIDPIGPIDPVDPVNPEEPKGIAWYWWAAGGVAVAALLTVVVVLVVRKKKKKAAADEWSN